VYMSLFRGAAGCTMSNGEREESDSRRQKARGARRHFAGACPAFASTRSTFGDNVFGGAMR